MFEAFAKAMADSLKKATDDEYYVCVVCNDDHLEDGL